MDMEICKMYTNISPKEMEPPWEEHYTKSGCGTITCHVKKGNKSHHIPTMESLYNTQLLLYSTTCNCESGNIICPQPT